MLKSCLDSFFFLSILIARLELFVQDQIPKLQGMDAVFSR